MTGHDPFIHDDGVYVLGALSTDERAAFERHLPSCVACTDRVRAVAALPALLSAVPADAYTAQDDPPATMLPLLLRRVRVERRRRNVLTTGLAGLAAACLVAVAIVAWPANRTATPASSQPRAMTALLSSPVHATAALSSVGWGTEIRLVCRYDGATAPGVDYQLVVIDRHNVKHPAGSWLLTPGGVTTFTGGTSVHRGDISSVEVTVGDTAILQLTH